LKTSRIFILIILALGLTSCQNSVSSRQNEETHSPATTSPLPTTLVPPTASPTVTVSPTPQPHLTLIPYGIDKKDFPENYNPLTGKAVQNAEQLSLPAILISVSNSPVSARPQAGLGFADWVFEYYIGASATRFLALFYGEYPRYLPAQNGNCPVNEEIFLPAEHWVGNRVWLDENENGIQDDWETGIGGVCVRLYADGKPLASTSTNANGYYAFNIPRLDKNYFIEIEKPENFTFTLQNVGNEEQDSDVDDKSGRTRIFRLTDTETNVDAGLIAPPEQIIVPTPFAPYVPPEAYAGPIRSGRLTYAHINRMFPQSCLIFAGAAPDILAQLSPCKIVYGVDLTTPNSALLPVSEMRQLAESHRGEKPPDYSGNLFDGNPPQVTREAASRLLIRYHPYNQSYWVYDPISRSYLRFTDNADGTGIFRPATDRLTGKQQSFENVIVLKAEHLIFRHNQYEIDLSPNQRGFAYLFRDGGMQKIYWSTENRDWEKKSGILRPIHFVDAENKPVALRPGKTWIHLVTPFSALSGNEGEWEMVFVQPYDPFDKK
jgi:hypothetical protein